MAGGVESLSLGAKKKKKKGEERTESGARMGGVVWTVVRTWTSRQLFFLK